jgi:uncharacterized protein YxjI
MVIEIIQKAIAMGHKYDVRVNGESTYRASGMPFAILGGSLTVSDTNGNTCAQIVRKPYVIRPNYQIVLSSGAVFHFKALSLIKGIYHCRNGSSQYFLYVHKGLLASIFRIDKQVAALMKSEITVLSGDYYSMLADDDEDKLILACIGIVFDNCGGVIGVSSAGIQETNFGNIIFRKDHPFDESWQPKVTKE